MATWQAARRQLPNVERLLHHHCQPCRRTFATTPLAQAGHNKWSKTKHIKAVLDKRKSKERTLMTKTISVLSRMYGDNLDYNPALASAVHQATKASVPKATIEAAIARGQGRSATGAQLESITVEALLPPNVAVLVECETDSRNRTVADLRNVIRDAGVLPSASAFYFTRRGRVVLRVPEGGPGPAEMFEEAVEQGVEDIEELPGGEYLLWTEPAHTMPVTRAMSQKSGVEISESDIVSAPNEDTMVDLEGSSRAAETLEKLLGSLKEFNEVKAIYANVRQGSVSDEAWSRIEENLDP